MTISYGHSSQASARGVSLRRRISTLPDISTPQVSVLMPVFNGDRFLAETIESILRQTFVDWEFVIVDDGSTDRTSEITGRYAALDQRIRVHHGDHAGIVNALNIGLTIARGDLVARIDADDVALPHRLKRQVEYLYRHPKCIAVGSSILKIDDRGESIGICEVPTSHESIVQTLLDRRSAMWHPTVTYRRRQILAVGGYDPKFEWAEDLDLWLRLDESGGLANLAEPLVKYRMHDANVGKKYGCRQQMIARRIIVSYCLRRDCSMPRVWQERVSDRMRRQVWICFEEGRALSALPWAVAAVFCNPFNPMNYRMLYLSIRRILTGR